MVLWHCRSKQTASVWRFGVVLLSNTTAWERGCDGARDRAILRSGSARVRGCLSVSTIVCLSEASVSVSSYTKGPVSG